jgi:hypothetical protein
MKPIINIINQVYEIEKKTQDHPSVQRNLERIRSELQALGYSYHSPLHEKYASTRTDCEATISGSPHEQMRITEVIKPIIRNEEGGQTRIIQKAIVVVA